VGICSDPITDGFLQRKLVTTGAYGVVRNPIYSSVTFFVLPAVALITSIWVYFLVSVFLYVGVMIFIGKEEQQLTQVFGKEYEDYVARVIGSFHSKDHDVTELSATLAHKYPEE